MNENKAIETIYKGCKFRSRLEARWAVFFDNCNADWEYEPEGYDLGNGIYNLPDFLIRNVDGRVGGDLYVEVKGVMTEKDMHKIKLFSGYKEIKKTFEGGYSSHIEIKNKTLILGNIPKGDSMSDIDNELSNVGYDYMNGFNIYPFNFEMIDGDYYLAHLGINKNGRFELFGDDYNYLIDRDDERTLYAYHRALQERFERK